MLSLRIAEEVLAAALKNGGEFAEIFLEDRTNNLLVMRNDTVETISSGRIHGAGVRVFHNLRCIYAYANDTSRQGLLDCAGKVAAAVRGAPANLSVTLAERPVASLHPIQKYPGDTQHTARIAVLREASKAARAVGAEVVQAHARYLDSDQRVLIANSEGLLTQDRRVYTRLSITAVASDGKENQTGSEGPGAMRGIELFETIDPAEAGRVAAERAVRMLHAPLCPAGVMPVVMAGGFGGVVFHEACGHSLEATSVGIGVSEFCGKLGQQIASPIVTAIDDGTLVNNWGQIHVDDEGTPSQRTVLIENGILKSYMVDRLGSRRMNHPITGSSRRESYAYAPTSRMRSTFIAPGNDSNEEIIASMGDGLYARKMGGGSVNPATGEFNFSVAEAYLVRNGKIAQPVRGASLIGRGSEILMKIDRVGKELELSQGMCGSKSGSVPTDVGQPMIRVSSITVGGR